MSISTPQRPPTAKRSPSILVTDARNNPAKPAPFAGASGRRMNSASSPSKPPLVTRNSGIRTPDGFKSVNGNSGNNALRRTSSDGAPISRDSSQKMSHQSYPNGPYKNKISTNYSSSSGKFGNISIDNILSDVSEIPSSQRRSPSVYNRNSQHGASGSQSFRNSLNAIPGAITNGPIHMSNHGNPNRPISRNYGMIGNPLNQAHRPIPPARKAIPPRLTQNLPPRTTKVSEKLVLIPESPQPEFLFDDDDSDENNSPPIEDTDNHSQTRKSYAERLPKERRTDKFPRVTAYCISESIRIGAAATFLRENHKIHPRIYNEALYAPYYLPLLPGDDENRVKSSPGGLLIMEQMIDHSEQQDHHYEYYSGLEGSREETQAGNGGREILDQAHTDLLDMETSPDFDPSEPQDFSPPSGNYLEDRLEAIQHSRSGENETDLVDSTENASRLIDLNGGQGRTGSEEGYVHDRNQNRGRGRDHDPYWSASIENTLETDSENSRRSQSRKDANEHYSPTETLSGSMNHERGNENNQHQQEDANHTHESSSENSKDKTTDNQQIGSSTEQRSDSNESYEKETHDTSEPYPFDQDSKSNAVTQIRSTDSDSSEFTRLSPTNITNPSAAAAAYKRTLEAADTSKHAEIFIFAYGVIVFWNFTEHQEKEILADLTFARVAEIVRSSSSSSSSELLDDGSHEDNEEDEDGDEEGMESTLIPKSLIIRPIPQESIETEELHFTYSPNTVKPRIYNDMITLRSGDHMTKLAMSHALAQSTKLSRFEARMDDNMHDVRHVPKMLALTGRLGLKREEVLRISGKLFKLRVDVNLSSNVLDTPDFFWEDEPSLNPLYAAVREYLEIEQRILVLNERCKVFLELTEILADSIAEYNMSRITWIIIILIVLSLVVSTFEIAMRFWIVKENSKPHHSFKSVE